MSLTSAMLDRFKARPARERPAQIDTLGVIGSPHRNLLPTSRGLEAWFLAGGIPWFCLSDDARLSAMHRFGHTLASLYLPDESVQIRWRLTGSPFDSAGWARRLDEAHPAPDPNVPRALLDRTRLPDPDPESGGQTFDEMLTAVQHRMGELGDRIPAVAFGVRITDRRMTENELVKMFRQTPLIEREGALEVHRQRLARVTEHTITSRAGSHHGRTATASDGSHGLRM